MATAPSAEDSARRILSIFAERQLRAGEILMLGEVDRAFQRDGYRGSDSVAGCEFAQEQGWLLFEGVSVRLLEKGFAEI